MYISSDVEWVQGIKDWILDELNLLYFKLNLYLKELLRLNLLIIQIWEVEAIYL